MLSRKSSFARVIDQLADSAVAAVASLWPRSTASLEANRLIADGYPAGKPADVYYLVSFDEAMPDDAFTALRAAGFAVRETTGPLRGFVTVRARLRLAAYDLSLGGARLDRVVEQFGGFATVIGAARPTNEEAARPVRVPRRSIAAV